MDGTRYADRDDDGLLIEHLHFECGCENLLDEFHDGSTHSKVVHHSGKVLVDVEIRGE